VKKNFQCSKPMSKTQRKWLMKILWTMQMEKQQWHILFKKSRHDQLLRKWKKNDPNEERLQKAFSILEASASGKEEETEFQIFGNLISKKLEKYSPATRNAVQQGIMVIIFNADTGFYKKPISKYSTESSGHILHPYYPSQTQNNPAQQSKHLQAPFCSSSAYFLFSPDTNTTTSSTYTCNAQIPFPSKYSSFFAFPRNHKCRFSWVIFP